MLADRALAYGIFALWVSFCAFAPEVVWQGFLILRGHFGVAEAYTVLFIGALFTFFVEPLVERFKATRWRLPRERPSSLLLGVLLPLLFGILLVCIHEAIAAYFGGNQTGGDAKQASLVQAITQAQEWISIPAVVTAAWLAAGTSRRLSRPAGGLACIWILAAGYVFDWGWPVSTTTAIPCCWIALLGTRVASQTWDRNTIPSIARIVALAAGCWVILAFLVQATVSSLGALRHEFYPPDQIFEDIRFYLGWFLGLSFAPNPVAADQPSRPPAKPTA